VLHVKPLEEVVNTTITNIKPLSGGDINEVYKLSTKNKTYCVKVNSSELFPGMFQAEKMGLERLKCSNTFTIPEVIAVLEKKGQSFLLMEYIFQGTKTREFWSDFATNLATMHQNSSDKFGLDHNNYIGSLQQINNEKTTWAEFYTENRLLYMFDLAKTSGHLSSSDGKALLNLCNRLTEIFPEEVPALLHGDLWGGNYLIDDNGKACLIDPAVYYGHREMDLGMMQLFGGFDSKVFDYYNERYPLEKHWQERVPITQLYPLLVHVNLFGSGYVSQVRRIIDKFRT